MFNIKPPKKQYNYVQSPQHNPIKWQVVTSRKGYWQAQTGIFRCREYFNDIVAKKHKRVYTVYGFNASPVRHKKDGIDVLIHDIQDMDCFLQNMDIIDDKLFADIGCRLTYVLDTECPNQLIIHFPPQCWDNTYVISVLTMMIRVANYPHSIETWEDLFKDGAPLDYWEHWYPNQRKLVEQWGFKLPEALKSYWWYSGEFLNNLQCTGLAHMIHNCGALTWIRHFPQLVSAPYAEETALSF